MQRRGFFGVVFGFLLSLLGLKPKVACPRVTEVVYRDTGESWICFNRGMRQ